MSGSPWQHQVHRDAATRRPAQRTDQSVPGKQVSVRDHDAMTCRTDRSEVVALDVVGVAPDVARDEQHLGLAGRGGRVGPHCPHSPPQPAPSVVERDRMQHEAMDHRDDRSGQEDRVVLLAHRPVVEQVVFGEVDAADERGRAVDDDDLAMHAPKQVQAMAQHPPARVEDAHLHPGRGQGTDEIGRQIR